MNPSDEFFNASDRIATTDGERRLESVTTLRGVTVALLRNNALVLQAIFQAVLNRSSSVPGAIVYIPPGRYYIGRTWGSGGRGAAVAQGELFGDLVVPAQVSLKFAPGAVLVPFDYSSRTDREAWAWNVPGRPWERYKVRIEVQGTIDAGIQQVFDVLLENLDDSDQLGRLEGFERSVSPRDIASHRAYYASNLHEAGQVLLTRNAIRAVYPEWWGAAPPPGTPHEGEPMAAVVRRTTLAIQAAIDAAHTNRLLHIGVRTSSRDTNATPMLQAYTVPPIPVLFSREYVIDRELMVGQSWWESERPILPAPMTAERDILAFRPTNSAGAILRGVRGPDRAGAGSARIVASPSHFFGDDRVDTPVVDRADARRYAPRFTDVMVGVRSDALLALRGTPSSVVEGIEFDGASTAARALTIGNGVTFGYDPQGVFGSFAPATQSLGIERCQFKGATSRLVHVGGELFASNRITRDGGLVKPVKDISDPRQTQQFLSSNDLTATRFLRCSFNTTSSQSQTVGVMFYGEQTLDLEFDRCAFSGPAAPMVHTFGGRVQFDGCVFWTRDVVGALTSPFPGSAYTSPPGGLDIYLDTPPLVGTAPLTSANDGAPQGTGVCVLRNVHSRSQKLLWSRTEVSHGQASTGVLLLRVTHEPEPEPFRPLAPAILWGAIAEHGGRLVLMACRFFRPDGPAAGERPPVGVLLGGASTRDQFVNALVPSFRRSATSSVGHVIDLGTRVDAAGGVVTPVVSVAPTVERGRALGLDGAQRAEIEALRIFERYEMT